MARLELRDGGLGERLRRAARGGLRESAIVPIIRKAGTAAQREMSFRVSGGRFRSSGVPQTSKRLRVRTGRLRSSLGFRIQRNPRTLALEIGVTKGEGGEVLKYAATHEFGATITPKSAKYLTIPLKAALTPAGVPRFTAREAESEYETAVVRFGESLLIIGRKRGTRRTSQRITPLFVLKKRVEIPERPFIGPAGQKAIDILRERLPAALARVFSKRG